MNDPAGMNEGSLRIAIPEDIPFLAKHRRLMFEEIQEQTRNPADIPVPAALETEYAAKFARELPLGTCTAWVVQIGDRIVSSGAVSVISYVPIPHDLSSNIAFLHSVYTEKEFRRRHFARRVTQAAADYCRDRESGASTFLPAIQGGACMRRPGLFLCRTRCCCCSNR